MFRSGSPYSPFFTSGFLSASPPSVPFPSPRRGSLPTDSPLRQAPAFYFTLQPKRDPSEYRSFLSLDLAESSSLRSASLNRKSEFFPARILPSVPESTPSLRLRGSRDSIRTLPSAKPAPSATLPDVPKSSISPLPPRLPSILINPTLHFSLDPRASSAPNPPFPPPPILNRLSTSTVSTRARTTNRSHALARLEGRSHSASRRPLTKPRLTNFMSLTDDEDDDGPVTLSAILEPEDVVFPVTNHPKSAPPDGKFPTSVFSHRRDNSQITSKDWFPLKSFIDFRPEDDMSRWSWRSFVQVATVS